MWTTRGAAWREQLQTAIPVPVLTTVGACVSSVATTAVQADADRLTGVAGPGPSRRKAGDSFLGPPGNFRCKRHSGSNIRIWGGRGRAADRAASESVDERGHHVTGCGEGGTAGFGASAWFRLVAKGIAAAFLVHWHETVMEEGAHEPSFAGGFG